MFTQTHTRRPRRIGVALFLTLSLTLTLASNTHAAAKRSLDNREATIHVLNRMAFGPRPGQVDAVLRGNWRTWVETQLNPETIDDAALDARIAGAYPSLAMDLTQTYGAYTVEPNYAIKGQPTTEERRAFSRQRGMLQNKVREELTMSVILRAAESERQFQEVMVEFWRNHFNIDQTKVTYQSNNYEEQVLRKHAFGKFEDLLMASAKHPAMLVYLDNFVSKAGALNENYAREIMELHTLGVDNYYTQEDVIELARVLTGWSCGWNSKGADRQYTFIYNDRNHDAKPATVVGLKIDGQGGLADGEKAVRYLAYHKGTAQFISRKLCVYLLDDHPPQELIDRVAAVFSETNGDLREVYREILFSPEFTDVTYYKSKFKTPFEFVASSLRATDARIDNPQSLLRSLKMMGQTVYQCDVPTGYYDQAESWLDPGVMVYRWDFAIQLQRGKLKGVSIPDSFYQPLTKISRSYAAKKLMQMIAPGPEDPATLKTLGRVSDLKNMTGLALGSAPFQQQ